MGGQLMLYNGQLTKELGETTPIRISNTEAYAFPRTLSGNIEVGDGTPNILIDTSSVGIGKSYSAMNGLLIRHKNANENLPLHRHSREVMFFIAPMKNQLGYSTTYANEAAKLHVQVLNFRSRDDIRPDALGKICAYTFSVDSDYPTVRMMSNEECYDIISSDKFYSDLHHTGTFFNPGVARNIKKNNDIATHKAILSDAPEDENEITEYINTCYEHGKNIRDKYIAGINSEDAKVRQSAADILRSDIRKFSNFLLWGFFYECDKAGAEITLKPLNEILDIMRHPMYSDAMNFLRFAAPIEMAKFQTSIIFMTLDKARLSISVETIKPASKVETIKSASKEVCSHMTSLCFGNVFSFVNNLKNYSPEVTDDLLTEGVHDKLIEGDSDLMALAQEVICKSAQKSRSRHFFETEEIPFTIFIDEEHDVCSRLSNKSITTLVGHTDEHEHQDGSPDKVEGLLSLVANAFRVMQKIEDEKVSSGRIKQYFDAVKRKKALQGDGFDEMDAALFRISQKFRSMARLHLPELFDNQRGCIDTMTRWFSGADHRGFTAVSSDIDTFKAIVGNSLNLGLTTIVGSNNLKSLFIDFEADGPGVRTYRITKNVRGSESLSLHNFIMIIMLYYKAAASIGYDTKKIQNRYENQDDVLVSFLKNVHTKRKLLRNVFNEVQKARIEINEFFTYFTYKVIPTLSVVTPFSQQSSAIESGNAIPDIVHIGLGLSIIGCPAELDIFRAIYSKQGESKNVVSVASATRGLHGAYATKFNLQNFFEFINRTMEISLGTILDVSRYNREELQRLAQARFNRIIGGLELSRVKVSDHRADMTTYRMNRLGEIDATPHESVTLLQPSENLRKFRSLLPHKKTTDNETNGFIFRSNRQYRETMRCFDFLEIAETRQQDALVFSNSNAPLRALKAIASMKQSFGRSGAFMYRWVKSRGYEIASPADFNEFLEGEHADDLKHFQCVVDKLQDVNKQKVAFIPGENGKSTLLICFDAKLGEDIEFANLVCKHHERQTVVIFTSHVSGGVGLNNVVWEFGGDYTEDYLRPEDEEVLFGITRDFQILAIASSNYYSAVRTPGRGYNNRENFNIAFKKLTDTISIPTMGDISNGLESKIIIEELRKENTTSLVSTIIQTIGRFERRNHTQTKAIFYLDDEDSMSMKDSAFEQDMRNLARFHASSPDEADQYISMSSVCTRGLFAMALVFAKTRTFDDETLGYLRDEGAYCERVRKGSNEFFGNDNSNGNGFRYWQIRARANDPCFSWVPDFNDTLRRCTTPDKLQHLQEDWHRTPGYAQAVAMGYGEATDTALSYMFYDLEFAETDEGEFFGPPKFKGKTIFINYETGRLSDLRDEKADIFDPDAVYSMADAIPIYLPSGRDKKDNFGTRSVVNDLLFRQNVNQNLKDFIERNRIQTPNPYLVPTVDMKKNIRGNIGEAITASVLKSYIDYVPTYEDVPRNRYVQLHTFLRQQQAAGHEAAVLKFRNISFEYADLALIDTENYNILAIDAKNIMRLNDETLRSLSEDRVFDKKQKFQAAFTECFGECHVDYVVINAAMSSIEINDLNHVFSGQSRDTGIYRYSLFSIIEEKDKRRCNGISSSLHNKIVEFMGVSPIIEIDDFYSLETEHSTH